jgi:predicted glycosyltransferase
MRALRVLLVANDGLSAGHVVRALAVARGLARRARARGIAIQSLLATTSEANALLAAEPIAVLRLPAPEAARRAGFDDAERRRLVRGAIAGAVSAFAPDLVVADTFPSGPHGELAGLDVGHAKRALVRRSVIDHDAIRAGLDAQDIAIVADDPQAHDARLPVRCFRVPPITLCEASEAKGRDEAREVLGIPRGARAVLVTSGGGGDGEGAARARRIAAALPPEVIPFVAEGPLANGVAPLQPLLAAFDGAFAAAGYNTAHELAKARVPAALFAQPRPFDDQAARAARFAALGLARVFDGDIAGALAWMRSARVQGLEAGGADRAAEILLDLATGKLR